MALRRRYAVIKEFVLLEKACIIEEAFNSAWHEVAVARMEEFNPQVTFARMEEFNPEEAAVRTEAKAIEEVKEPADEFFFGDDFEPIEEIVEQLPEPPKKPRAPAKAFDFKIVTADEITQDRFNELKNFAMQYKKVKSRVSKKFDSLNCGRIQFVKFGLAGKTLKVYLNLPLDETEPKFHCKDQSFKKPYVMVPTLIRVKSGRAVKYAKRLITQCADKNGLVPNKKYVPADYITLMEEFYNANLGRDLDEAAATEEE